MRKMEFLLVVYDIERDVLIDGVPAGITNHLITLAPGTYTVSLDGESDFEPAEQEILVTGSSPLRPMKVQFA
jgi:hypothetical protein